MDDAKLKADLTWIQKHERIIALFLVLAVGVFLGNLYINKSAETAHDNAVVALEVAKAQTEANKQVAAQIALQTAAFENDRITRQQEQQTLLAAIGARDRALKTNVAAASGPKTPPEAVKDISTAYNLPEPIVPTDIGAVVPTKDLQLFTVTKLQGDVCSQDLTDANAMLASSQAGEKQATDLVTALQAQVKGKDVEIQKNDASSKAEIKDLKAQARKSKRNWFLAGYVLGVGTRGIVKIFTGL
jgi:hypothetical protein